MIRFQRRDTFRLVLAFLILWVGRAYGQTQTPGQVTQFDPSLNVIDSVITQDASGNIGIGTTTPVAALDVATGDLNVAGNIFLAGNIFKGGRLFIHDCCFANTFIGQQAGNLSMTGGHNTASGFQAFYSNTTGLWNTASGSGALALNTTGSYNTASGANALLYNSDGFNNTASGISALEANTTGCCNTASGYYALYANTTGCCNTASGHATLRSNTTGFANTAIGAFTDVSQGDLSNATAIGYGTIVNASNKIRLGNTSVTVIEGQVPYTFISDRNQKENFHAVDGEAVLKKVGGLTLTSWNYIGHDPQQFRHYGPVAQEFFAAFGQDAVGTIGTPTTINSGDLEGILMIAVQALEQRTTELDKRTAENAELRTRIEALERLVQGVTAGVR